MLDLEIQVQRGGYILPLSQQQGRRIQLFTSAFYAFNKSPALSSSFATDNGLFISTLSSCQLSGHMWACSFTHLQKRLHVHSSIPSVQAQSKHALRTMSKKKPFPLYRQCLSDLRFNSRARGSTQMHTLVQFSMAMSERECVYLFLYVVGT